MRRKSTIEVSRMQPVNRSYQTDTGIGVAELSLLDVCETCRGRCCVGRTMATSEERRTIVDYSSSNFFIRWRDDLWYLDSGVCPYLRNGLCSVQEVKPFVCQIYPFVPRVISGELWLYCVGECDAGSRLPPEFAEKAVALTRAFFKEIPLEAYARYWNENKAGDFDDSRVWQKIRVFGISVHGGER